LVTTIGVKDLVVVGTPDAIMVAARERSQEVKDLVAKLKKNKRTEAESHRRVDRPWGYYQTIDAGDRFQVKRIVVLAGGTLSLQKTPSSGRTLGHRSRHC
jgi:mannose-1-phosphate guanylyltransferase / mannose-6-phosphate isomerase